MQLSEATQQNASASEQLAATSEEMSGQAEQLQQLMEFFRVGESSQAGRDKLRQIPRSKTPNPKLRSLSAQNFVSFEG